jgi:cold shock CspA family protein
MGTFHKQTDNRMRRRIRIHLLFLCQNILGTGRFPNQTHGFGFQRADTYTHMTHEQCYQAPLLTPDTKPTYQTPLET